MTLWRLESLRLWRTKRWLILVGVYGFFGLIGPLTARYLPEIIDRLGGADAITGLPELTAEDGMTQYLGNAQQLGLLAVVFVAAAALAFDANKEMSIFLRTRASVASIMSPRYVVTAGAAAVSFLIGAAIAYLGTGLLLEWLDLGAVLIGSALQILYLVLAVVLTGLVSSFVRNVPGVALLALGILIVVGLLGLIPAISDWLPSELLGGLDILIRGGDFELWPAIVVTVALTAVMVWITLVRLEHREV